MDIYPVRRVGGRTFSEIFADASKDMDAADHRDGIAIIAVPRTSLWQRIRARWRK
jgi:hypothetical protein